MKSTVEQTDVDPSIVAQLEALEADNKTLQKESETYKNLYMEMLEKYRRLELGLLGQKAERLEPSEKQLTLDILASLFGEDDETGSDKEPESEPVEVAAHKRKKKPTGRQPLPESLPRVTVEILPPEVEAEGLDAFERVREEVTETIERRPSSFVVVRTVRPIFVRKDRNRDRREEVRRERELKNESHTEFHIADVPRLPIERGKAGPTLLADTIVKRFQDHLPYHRLESIYARDGVQIARSTMCSWHEKLDELIKPLVDVMWADALEQNLLCIDATGVLVQAPKKCHRAHFWVVVSPERHALFGFSKTHKKETVDALLGGFEGYLVADAHTVYDHLYLDEKVMEAGCWAHARRYFYKAFSSQPDEAAVAMGLISRLFELERSWKSLGIRKRLNLRKKHSAELVEQFYEWCQKTGEQALEETPLAKALTYARNQKDALSRFLEDGRIPLSNNISERALRRQAVGRKNWLFIGSTRGGHTNARMVSLLASCQMHSVEPRAYLRDILVLLKDWPEKNLLELAPLNWAETRVRKDVQHLLDLNIYWRVATMGDDLVPAAPD